MWMWMWMWNALDFGVTAGASTTAECPCLILLQRAPDALCFIVLLRPSPSLSTNPPSHFKPKNLCKDLDTSL